MPEVTQFGTSPDQKKKNLWGVPLSLDELQGDGGPYTVSKDKKTAARNLGADDQPLHSYAPDSPSVDDLLAQAHGTLDRANAFQDWDSTPPKSRPQTSYPEDALFQNPVYKALIPLATGAAGFAAGGPIGAGAGTALGRMAGGASPTEAATEGALTTGLGYVPASAALKATGALTGGYEGYKYGGLPGAVTGAVAGGYTGGKLGKLQSVLGKFLSGKAAATAGVEGTEAAAAEAGSGSNSFWSWLDNKLGGAATKRPPVEPSEGTFYEPGAGVGRPTQPIDYATPASTAKPVRTSTSTGTSTARPSATASTGVPMLDTPRLRNLSQDITGSRSMGLENLTDQDLSKLSQPVGEQDITDLAQGYGRRPSIQALSGEARQPGGADLQGGSATSIPGPPGWNTPASQGRINFLSRGVQDVPETEPVSAGIHGTDIAPSAQSGLGRAMPSGVPTPGRGQANLINPRQNGLEMVKSWDQEHGGNWFKGNNPTTLNRMPTLDEVPSDGSESANRLRQWIKTQNHMAQKYWTDRVNTSLAGR